MNMKILLAYPELNIPKLDPYKPPNLWKIHTRDITLPINVVGNWSNISIYGFEEIVIQRFKYAH